MKYLFSLLTCLLLINSLFAQTEDEIIYPGEHFSLEGAVDLFLKAKTLEDFETQINDVKNTVNNLDLNEDGEVDYIRVVDHMEADVHAIVLQVPISEKESQDIAVIEIERTGDASAVLQIIGNEEVYGEEVFVEPFEEKAYGRDGKGGPSGGDYYVARVVVNVWAYPSVRYIYRPAYRQWVSPYRWRVYPKRWKPWRPVTWAVYRPRTLVWHNTCRRVTTHRVVKAHKVYVPKRTSSIKVTQRTALVRTNQKTYQKKTTVVRNGQGNVAVKQTKKGVKTNQNTGNVKAKKKTTKVAAKTKKGKVAGVKKTKKVKRKKG